MRFRRNVRARETAQAVSARSRMTSSCRVSPMAHVGADPASHRLARRTRRRLHGAVGGRVRADGRHRLRGERRPRRNDGRHRPSSRGRRTPASRATSDNGNKAATADKAAATSDDELRQVRGRGQPPIVERVGAGRRPELQRRVRTGSHRAETSTLSATSRRGTRTTPRRSRLRDSAVPDHLANHPGDSLGPCQEEPGPLTISTGRRC